MHQLFGALLARLCHAATSTAHQQLAPSCPGISGRRWPEGTELEELAQEAGLAGEGRDEDDDEDESEDAAEVLATGSSG